MYNLYYFANDRAILDDFFFSFKVWYCHTDWPQARNDYTGLFQKRAWTGAGTGTRRTRRLVTIMSVTHSGLEYNEKRRVLKFVRCDSHTHTTSSEHRKRWLWQHDQNRFDTIILISFVHPFVLHRAMKIMLPCICNVGRTFYPQKRLFVNLNILICWFCKHVLDIVNIKIKCGYLPLQ